MTAAVNFCRSADGTRIAFSAHGQGAPLLRLGTWPSHLEIDASSPITGPLILALAQRHTLIRFDLRGTGLSERHAPDLTFDRLVDDLEAVIDAAQLSQFSILAHGQGAAISMAYIARHPGRCSKLIAHGGYLQGRITRARDAVEVEQNDLFERLVRAGWDKPTPTFRRVFSSLFFPDATTAELSAWDELQHRAASAEVAVELIGTFGRIDVTHLAGQVMVPTLVIHSEGDLRVPVGEGRRLAASVAGAQFISLPCRNHHCLRRDAIWSEYLDLVTRFLDELDLHDADPRQARWLANSLTAREAEVLDLIARGLTNSEIGLQLSISHNTLRNHIARVFSKLEVRTRAQAIVKAREVGFGARRQRTSPAKPGHSGMPRRDFLFERFDS